MEFVYTAGHEGYANYREAIDRQRAGYMVAGLKPGPKTCGTVPVVGGQVALGTSGKGVQVSGMWRCGNRWCGECRAKVARHKSGEVEHAVKWAMDQGLIVAMFTPTAAHVTTADLEAAGFSLHVAVQGVTTRELRKLNSQAWRLANNGRRGTSLRKRRVGTITGEELTLDDLMLARSLTGIHWHRHILVFLKPVAGMSALEVANAYGDELLGYWQSGCAAVDLKASPEGFHVAVASDEEEALTLGDYVTKMDADPAAPAEAYAAESIHLEVTRAEGKEGRKLGRVTPEQLLRNIAYLAEVEPEGKRLKRLIAQWRDLEEGAKGVHWLRWSPGLRSLVGLDEEELTDEEIANTDAPVESEHVAVVSWDELREHVEELRRIVRDAEDGEEFATLILCLDSWGIAYHLETVEEWRERLALRVKSLRSGGA